MKGHVILSILSALIVLMSGTAFAQTDININNRNLIRFGGDVTVAENQVVENAHAIGGSVTLQPGARVTETAIAIGGNVVLRKDARVDGDAYSVGGQVVQDPGATIGGARQAFGDQRPGRRPGMPGMFARYLFNSIFHTLTALVAVAIGVLLLLWQPNFLLTLATLVNQFPGRIGLWGFLGAIALIVLNVFLAISLIGIPLIPLVNLAAFVIALLGTLGVTLLIGQKLFAAAGRTPVQQFLIGALIVWLAGLIPIVGGLFLLVINILGFGALLAWKLGRMQPQPTG